MLPFNLYFTHYPYRIFIIIKYTIIFSDEKTTRNIDNSS